MHIYSHHPPSMINEIPQCIKKNDSQTHHHLRNISIVPTIVKNAYKTLVAKPKEKDLNKRKQIKHIQFNLPYFTTANTNIGNSFPRLVTNISNYTKTFKQFLATAQNSLIRVWPTLQENSHPHTTKKYYRKYTPKIQSHATVSLKATAP